MKYFLSILGFFMIVTNLSAGIIESFMGRHTDSIYHTIVVGLFFIGLSILTSKDTQND